MRLQRRSVWPVALVVFVFTSLSVALGAVTAVNHKIDSVNVVPELATALSPPTAGIVNYLMVGSDSRSGFASPADDPFAVGSEDLGLGQRSDTMIVLRYDSGSGSIALLSIPRDLYVSISGAGKDDRINSAFSRGPDVLVKTVQTALGIPIHHYLEVSLLGFKQVVDAIKGVEICVPHSARDQKIGLILLYPGCYRMDGALALAYSRSRYYEEKIDGEWVIDGTSDIGRSTRQRAFIVAMIKQTAKYAAAHPFETSDLISSLAEAVRVDPNLDLMTFARRMRKVADGVSESFQLPVENARIDGQSVLVLMQDSAAPIIQYFAGNGPKPVDGQTPVP